MEADWDELSRIPVPAPSVHAMPTIATAIAFDDVMELLWAGNEYVGSCVGVKLLTRGCANRCLGLAFRDELPPSAAPNYRGIPLSGHTLRRRRYGRLFSMKGASSRCHRKVYI